MTNDDDHQAALFKATKEIATILMRFGPHDRESMLESVRVLAVPPPIDDPSPRPQLRAVPDDNLEPEER